MTVETTDRKQTYAGAQGSLTFTFRALTSAPTDIKCRVTLISTGAETELAYTTGYTAAINSNGVGGVVTVSPTYSALYTYTVYRETTDTQESDYDDYNQFPADTLETDLDRRTMKSQEVAEESVRSLRVPITYTGSTLSLPLPSAGKVLTWNTTESGMENADYSSDAVTAAEAAQAAAELAQTGAETAETNAETAETNAEAAESSAGTYSTLAIAALAAMTDVGIEFLIDGGGAEIATGIAGDLEIPFACSITSATIVANTTGSIVVDVWKDTYANFPPTVADTIVSNSTLAISAATKGQDTALAGWTKTIAAGDILRFNVDSVTDIERCTVSLKVVRT